MRIRVYRNLHKHCFSIQSYVPKRGWRVVRHAEIVYLSNVEFRVSKTGRERVLKEKKKNVHAWVIGDEVEEFELCNKVLVKYNPYLNKTFVNNIGSSVLFAPFARAELCGGRTFVYYSDTVR